MRRHNGSTARRLPTRAPIVLALALTTAMSFVACGDDFNFRPSGVGRGDGAIYDRPPEQGGLYDTPTATPAS